MGGGNSKKDKAEVITAEAANMQKAGSK